MKPRRELSVILAIVVGVIPTATACAAEARPALPPLPPGAQRPFDLFRSADVALINDAQIKLQSQCMVDRGYSQFSNLLAVHTEPGFGFEADPFEPRTEEQARLYGLGKPRPATPGRVSGAGDAAYNSAIDHCEETAWKAVVDTGPFRQYYQLGNALASEYGGVLDEVGEDFRDAVIDCLSAGGFTAAGGDPGSPESFGVKLGSHVGGSEPAGEDGGTTVTVHPPTPAIEYVPTQQEVDFAVALVRCRTETGLFAKADQVAEEEQRSIVEDHAVEFVELNPTIEAAAKEAAKVLGR
ncbi:hypothetical protein DFQ13_115121 [Actinokineospora spheciospongiae]|nr:hypothetical protein DFQ13_115121 [Actinokineospora spheciospongiae]